MMALSRSSLFELSQFNCKVFYAPVVKFHKCSYEGLFCFLIELIFLKVLSRHDVSLPIVSQRFWACFFLSVGLQCSDGIVRAVDLSWMVLSSSLWPDFLEPELAVVLADLKLSSWWRFLLVLFAGLL